MLGHGAERLVPPLARALCRTYDDLCILDVELDLLTKAALLEEHLWNADALRVADFDNASLHGEMPPLRMITLDSYNVITMGKKSKGSIIQWEVKGTDCRAVRGL
jgi:hypothetical protein